jgi:hypothetical protein
MRTQKVSQRYHSVVMRPVAGSESGTLMSGIGGGSGVVVGIVCFQLLQSRRVRRPMARPR